MVHPLLNKLSPLTQIEFALKAIGYDTYYYSPFDIQDQQFEQLAIVIHTDEDGEDYSVMMSFINDILQTARREAKIPPYPDRAYTLQMSVGFPFEIQDHQWGEVACLTLEINRFIEFGAFGVNPAEGLYYRYSLVHESTEVNLVVLAEVLDKIASYLRSVLVLFKQYFAGTKTLDDLYDMLDDAQNQANKGT